MDTPLRDSPVTEAGAYTNGGVGIDERQAMHLERGRYNLHLAFAHARSGEYLAGVTATIQRLGTSESPVRYEDSGPILYVKLAPGRYQIRAEYRGEGQRATVAVGSRATDHVMYWR